MSEDSSSPPGLLEAPCGGKRAVASEIAVGRNIASEG